jgi:hypothetical protein
MVNAGVRVPATCEVHRIRGVLMSHTAPISSPVESIHAGSRGFTVTPGLPAGKTALDAMVHSWHDGLSAVGVVVAYDIWEPPGVDCSVPGALKPEP